MRLNEHQPLLLPSLRKVAAVLEHRNFVAGTAK